MRAGRAPRPTAAAAPAQEGRTLLPDLLSKKKENVFLRHLKPFHRARRGRCRCPSGRGTKAVSGGGACWVIIFDASVRCCHFCRGVPYQFCCSCRCTMRAACHVECQFARPGMRARSTSRGGSPWAGNVRAAGKQTQAGARRQAGVCERIQRASTEFLAVSRRVTRASPSSSSVKK